MHVGNFYNQSLSETIFLVSTNKVRSKILASKFKTIDLYAKV